MNLLLKRRRIIFSQKGEDTTDYTLLPLTFKCLTGGDLSIKNENTSYDRNFEYSLNGGAWTEFELPKNTASKLIASLSPNDTISFRRDNVNFADAKFISDSNLTFDIYGNLLSLQYGSAFSGQTDLRNTAKKAFGAIFTGTNVVDASKLMLTAPTLSNDCYNGMFQHCTSLVSAPIIFAIRLGTNSCKRMFSECYNLVNVQPQLYTTTLSTGCCQEMFNDCQSLVNAPELPATTLAESCYQSMFQNCSNFVNAPNLPATTLADKCYQSMFEGCTSLTVAPELPATTLTLGCYRAMFSGCTSLTVAPELKAQTLVDICYNTMFYGCSNLNYIKCLATDISASNCLYNWVGQILNQNGTFVKNSTMNSWTQGPHGIPNGWNQAVEIEYLESSGTQYIDTVIQGSATDIEIEIKIQIVGNLGNFDTLIGSQLGGANYYEPLAINQSSLPYIQIGDGSSHTRVDGVNVSLPTVFKTGLKNGTLSIEANGVVSTKAKSGTILVSPLYMFARYRYDIGVGNYTKARIFYTKIWNNGVLVREFYPVRVGSVGYMYDRVSKQLFGNAGTGDFILGPDKVN